MSPKQEQCILEGLLKAVDSPKQKRRRWRYWLAWFVLWLAATAMFIVVIQTVGKLRWPHFLLAGGSFVLGVLFAYDLYKTMITQQWPVMSQYVNREQVERRLAELRTEQFIQAEPASLDGSNV